MLPEMLVPCVKKDILVFTQRIMRKTINPCVYPEYRIYYSTCFSAEGHTGVVRCLQADSWRIVSAADDKTLKVGYPDFFVKLDFEIAVDQQTMARD